MEVCELFGFSLDLFPRGRVAAAGSQWADAMLLPRELSAESSSSSSWSQDDKVSRRARNTATICADGRVEIRCRRYVVVGKVPFLGNGNSVCNM